MAKKRAMRTVITAAAGADYYEKEIMEEGGIGTGFFLPVVVDSL